MYREDEKNDELRLVSVNESLKFISPSSLTVTDVRMLVEIWERAAYLLKQAGHQGLLRADDVTADEYERLMYYLETTIPEHEMTMVII